MRPASLAGALSPDGIAGVPEVEWEALCQRGTARLLDKLTVAQARELRATGVLGASSMAPKVESAVDYVTATGRAARMLHTEELARAWARRQRARLSCRRRGRTLCVYKRPNAVDRGTEQQTFNLK